MFGRSVIRIVDLDARARRRAQTRDDLGGVLVGVAWMLFGFRVELLALAVLSGVDRLVASVAGEVAGVVVVLAIVVVLIAWRPARMRIGRVLRAMRVRRAWAWAAIDSGVAAGPFRTPGVRRVGRIEAGDRLRVRMRRGQSVPMLEQRREELAACMRLRDVRVLRDPRDAAEADVVLVRRDPFENAAPMPWPCADAEELSLWEPIPIGVDEQGEPVLVELAERNVLSGGEPGAGKSAALSIVIAAAALDRGTELSLMDGKGVELAAWAPVAERLVGAEGEDALSLLWELREVMDARYKELLRRGLRKIRREEGLPLHLVVVDELAFYLTLPDKDQRREFAELLRDLVARGRAAGVIVCAATQKPGTDIVPSSLRDLFGFRLALRCTTPQASDTILGQGWASNDADASTIPGAQRGVGYLLGEGERPVKIRSYYLDDDTIGAIAERVASRRTDEWLGEEGSS